MYILCGKVRFSILLTFLESFALFNENDSFIGERLNGLGKQIKDKTILQIYIKQFNVNSSESVIKRKL